MNLLPKKSLAMLLVLVSTIRGNAAQQSVSLAKHAVAVKEKASKLRLGDRISVVRVQAEEEYGTFEISGPDDFSFQDVDLNRRVTLRYEDVKKIKDGYGGYNSVSGRHTDRTKAYIVIGVIAGLLIGVIVAAASAKN